MNQQDNSSSQSGSLRDLFKKVEYRGKIDSQDSQSSVIDQEDHQPQKHNHSISRKISSLVKNQTGDSKTKIIKKNCVSAKKSRQRKKLYIELLEQKAQSLKSEIRNRKEQIIQQKASILNIIKQSNKEKYIYIQQKIKDSKQIASIIKTNHNLKKQVNNQQKNKDIIYLQYIVNSFFYKYGFNGILKNDILQLQKQRWLELAIDEKTVDQSPKELQKNLNNFNNCIRELEDNSKRIGWLVRNLKQKIKQQVVARFLIDKIFLL